jgi:hypothetical protein
MSWFEQQWREVLSADLHCNKDRWGCGFDLEVGDGFLISQFFVGSGGGWMITVILFGFRGASGLCCNTPITVVAIAHVKDLMHDPKVPGMSFVMNK